MGDLSVHINGKNGPVLHLYRGCTYFFCVEQEIPEGQDPKHAFILTNSPAGGPDSRLIPGGFAPVSKGCVCFKVDKCTPRYFFYQESKNAFAGGLVIVHDK
jgi:YHS domain-containing protein